MNEENVIDYCTQAQGYCGNKAIEIFQVVDAS